MIAALARFERDLIQEEPGPVCKRRKSGPDVVVAKRS
jgi:hypothetical protein